MRPREVLATGGVIVWMLFGYGMCAGWHQDYEMHDDWVVAHAEVVR